LSIFDGRGKPIKLVSSSSLEEEQDQGNVGQVSSFADFILQSVDDVRVEKQQIIETFGDSFVFFFGERPRVITMRGLLVNTEDFNWRAQFMSNYENYLRGTKLVQRNARAFLSYDSVVVEGYPINVTARDDANLPYQVSFEMSIFLTNYTDFSSVGVVDFPGGFEGDIDELVGVRNRALADAANNRPPSITSQVRLQNLLEITSGSVESLGQFAREVTKVTNSVFNTVDAARTLGQATLSGRTLTRPLGAAGFFSQIGVAGLLSSSSVSDEFTNLAQSLGLGGQLDDLPGSLRVVVPRRTNFVAPIEARTRISRNVDEYPLLRGAQFFSDTELDRQLKLRRKMRKETKEAQQAELLLINAKAESERDILRAFSDVADLARGGFALAATAKGIAADPVRGAAKLLGVDGVLSGGQERFADPSSVDTSALRAQGGGIGIASDRFLSETEVGVSGIIVGGQDRFGSSGSVDTASLTPEGGGLPRFPPPPGE
jgi:hypothetical protein